MSHPRSTLHRSLRTAIGTLLLHLSLVAAASALPSDLVREQNLRRGSVSASDSYGPDRIDRFNGNLALTLGLGLSYPASGSFPYRFQVHYNSQVWTFAESTGSQGQALVTAQPASSLAGFGWDFSFGRLSEPTGTTGTASRWVFADANGSRHVMYETPRAGDSPTPGTLYTRDGSFLRMTLLADGRRELRHPNGVRRTFAKVGADWFLEEIRDPHGSGLQFTPSLDGWSWIVSDGHRSHTVHFTADPSGFYPKLLDRIELAAPHGATAVHSFEYTAVAVDRPSSDNDPASPATVNIPVLTRIVHPDGSDYELGYHSDPAASGLLASLRLPTYGLLEWSYQPWRFPWLDCTPGSHPHLTDTVGIASRKMTHKNGTVAGNWTYGQYLETARPLTPTCEQPKERSTVVIDPLGHERRYYFSAFVSGTSTAVAGAWDPAEYGLPITHRIPAHGGHLLSSQVLENGTLIRRGYRSFEHESFADCTGPCAGTGARQLAHRQVYVDDYWHWRETARSDYGGWGRFRTLTKSSSFPGDVATVATDDLSHNLSAWQLNQVTRTQRTRGTESRIVEVCLDPRGRVLRRRQLAGTAPGPHDLLSDYSYDTAGQRTAERFHGGDVESLPTTGDLCLLNLPAAQFEKTQSWQYGALAKRQWVDAQGSTALSLADFDIDPASGLTLSSRDRSSYRTSYQYDLMGRRTRSTPQEGGGRLWIHQIASETARARTFTHDLAADGTTILARSQRKVDDFDRFFVRQDTDSQNSWNSASVWKFDAVGNLESKRDPLLRTTTWLEYDPFGRPRRVRPASGSADDRVTLYKGERQEVRTHRAGHYLTDPALSLVQETRTETTDFDRDGQPVKIVDAEGDVSRMRYDIDGRLVWMSLERANDVPVTLQDQLWDGRGFLVSSTDSDGTTTAHQGYDALGNRTTLEGEHGTVVRHYDRAGRLTEVRGSSGTVYQRFVYAYSNGGGNWRKGKLERAERYNYGIAGISGSAVVTEDNVYAGRGGRISQRTTRLLDGTSVRQTFTMAATWDDLGQLATFEFPQCSSSWQMTCHTLARTLHFDRYAKNGRYLEAVRSRLNGGADIHFVDQITYHDDGSPETLWYGAGRDLWESHTPHATAAGGVERSSICTAGSCNHFDSTSYDGSGALARIDSGPVFPETETFLPIGPPISASHLPTASELRELISSGGTSPSSCPTYRYDELGAVTRVTRCAGEINPKHTDYVYDTRGRVLWKVGSNEGLYPLPYTSTWKLFDFAGRLVREIDRESPGFTRVYDSIYAGSRLVGQTTAWSSTVFEAYRAFVHSDYAGRPFSKHTVENGQIGSWERW